MKNTLVKNRFVKLSLYLLILFAGVILTVTIGATLLSSSGTLMGVADYIQGIPVSLLFVLRVCVYTGLYFVLPNIIRKKRPQASADLIRRAQTSLLRILVVYELLFGLNLIGLLLGAAS